MDGIWLVLFVGVLVWLLIHRRRQAMILRRLAQHGVLTQANVLRCIRRRPPKGIRPPIIEYVFETAAGEQISGRSSATAGECHDIAKGGRITVIYDAGSPTLNRTRTYLVRKGYTQV